MSTETKDKSGSRRFTIYLNPDNQTDNAVIRCIEKLGEDIGAQSVLRRALIVGIEALSLGEASILASDVMSDVAHTITEMHRSSGVADPGLRRHRRRRSASDVVTSTRGARPTVTEALKDVAQDYSDKEAPAPSDPEGEVDAPNDADALHISGDNEVHPLQNAVSPETNDDADPSQAGTLEAGDTPPEMSEEEDEGVLGGDLPTVTQSDAAEDTPAELPHQVETSPDESDPAVETAGSDAEDGEEVTSEGEEIQATEAPLIAEDQSAPEQTSAPTSPPQDTGGGQTLDPAIAALLQLHAPQPQRSSEADGAGKLGERTTIHSTPQRSDQS